MSKSNVTRAVRRWHQCARPWAARAASLKVVPLAVALLLGSAATWPQGYYRAQALPVLGAYPFYEGWTMGFALNDSGVIVGNSQGLSAVRWSFLDGLQSVYSGRAFGIANNGTMVGYLDLGQGGNQVTPVRWSPTIGFQSLSSVYAGAPVNGAAWAVNDQGWVLATDLTGGQNNGMLLLRPGQEALNLGPLAGGGLAAGPMINASGMVAGSTDNNNTTGAPAQGFIWTPSGGARTFEAVAGARTGVTGLNDNGLVVGSGGEVGFVYNANTGTVLQTLPGFAPADINNAGSIVGDWGGAASEWRNGSIVDLNSVTADLGSYHLHRAIDINNNGQILALGVVKPGNEPNPPEPWFGLRTFLLSACVRCGQIKPNPNPASTLLDIGPDWFDAFNGEDYRNAGTLQIRTTVANVQGAVLRNDGDITVLASPGWLRNNGVLNNDPYGRIIVSGTFSSGGAGGVLNRGSVRMLEGSDAYFGGSGGFVNGSQSRFTQVGGSVRNAALFSVDDALFDQQGGSFQNLAGGTFRMWSGDAVIGGSFTNAGTLLMEEDPLAPIGIPSRPSQMRITGTFDNQAGSSFTASTSSLLEVAGGQLLNRGNLTLDSSTSRLTLRNGGSINNDGGTLRLDAGSRLLVANDAGSLQQASGSIVVANGARIDLGSTREMNVLGGSVSNEGVITASSGRITNSGAFTLQTGSRVELGTGASFEQVAGELLVAEGASISGEGLLNHTGGTTTVNGTVSLQSSVFSGGVLRGRGTIGGNVVLTNTIDLRGGNSPGTLTFLGNVDLVDATIELEIGSRNSFDKVVVGGNLNIGQVTARWVPYGGYVPDLNDSFPWLSAGSISGSALQVDTSLLPAGWRGVLGNAGGSLDMWNDAAVALAPSPNPVGTTLGVAAGALAYNALGNGSFFDNRGTVEVAGALANRPGASFMLQDGAQLNVLAGGRVSNRGFISGQGAIDNAGLLINYKDGEISARELTNRGRFENDGRIMTMRLENTGQWLHSGTGFVMTLDNRATGRIELLRGSSLEAVNLNNEGDMTVLGSLRVYTRIANQGRFEVAAGGSVLADPDNPFTTGGYVDVSGQAVTRIDGLLHAGQIKLNGRLQGNGTLRGNVIPGSDEANINPGNSVGTLTIEGNLQAARWGEGAQLNLEIDSAQSYDRLIVTGNANIGSIYFLLPTDFRPGAGDSFSVLSVGGVLDGRGTTNWAIYRIDYSGGLVYWGGPGGVSDPYTPGAANLRLSFANGTLSVTAVPEPHTWALMLGGLLAVGWFKRRALGA